MTERRDAALLVLLLIFMTACNPLGWRQNCIALILPYFFVLDALSRSLQRRWALLTLLVPALLLIYLKGEDPNNAYLHWMQVYGGRFWANVLLAEAALIAFYVANRPAAVRIADISDADRRPSQFPVVVPSTRHKAAA
jgi:hypothetical protein